MGKSTTLGSSLRQLLVALCLAASVQACENIDGTQILGKDLAKADPRFGAIPAEMVIGFTAMPGLHRVIDVRTLVGISRQFGIDAQGLTALCFDRPTELLSASKLQPALERVLGKDVKLEIVDLSRFPIPDGELVFSIKDLMKPPVATPDAPVTWRGHVVYGSRNTFSVWAKVRVAKLETWVETVTAIEAHKAIQPNQVTVKSGWRFPFAAGPLATVEQAIGNQATRSLVPGQVVYATMIETPPEIVRGEDVNVEVSSGAVSLRFTARAEASGRLNDYVVVFQGETGKRYHGRVQDKGKVLIDVDSRKKTDVVRGRPGGAPAGDVAISPRESEEN